MQEEFDPIVAEWASFANNPSLNLAQKCLKLAQGTEYPKLDVDKYIQKIIRIGNSLREAAGGSEATLDHLNFHMFANMGFAGDIHYHPRGNFLNELIDSKSGLPITMSVLYVEVAKFIDMNMDIIGFSGNVLVRYGDILLNPFRDGMKVDHIQDTGDSPTISARPEDFEILEHWQILVMLARNLRNHYTQSYNYEMASRCASMTLATGPNMPDDIRDKGILEWLALRRDSSIIYLNQYLEINPNADDADYILELVENIQAD